jgi:hypothetical protein
MKVHRRTAMFPPARSPAAGNCGDHPRAITPVKRAQLLGTSLSMSSPRAPPCLVASTAVMSDFFVQARAGA